MAKAIFEKFITVKGFIVVVMCVTVAILYITKGEIPQSLISVFSIIIYDFFKDTNDNGINLIRKDEKNENH